MARMREERDHWEGVARAAYVRAERERERRELLIEALERVLDAWENDRSELAPRVAEARELLAKEAEASAWDRARARPVRRRR